ncbi:hypothetical protein SLA2020_327290 [Shorea laevis]
MYPTKCVSNVVISEAKDKLFQCTTQCKLQVKQTCPMPFSRFMKNPLQYFLEAHRNSKRYCSMKADSSYNYLYWISMISILIFFAEYESEACRLL